MKTMIKHYLIICIGLILLTSCEKMLGEKKVDWDKESNLFSVSPEGKLFYNSELYSGIILNFQYSRNFYKEYSELKIGPYNPDMKYSTSSWKEGVPHGFWEGVHTEQNRIRNTRNYKNGLLHGPYEYYYEGVRQEKYEYEEGDLRSGEMTEFLDSKLEGGKRITRYLNNERHGVLESFYPNGNIGERVTFNNGYMSSDYEVFYFDGNVMCRVKNKNGKPGEVMYFRNDGTQIPNEEYMTGFSSPGEYDFLLESRKTIDSFRNF